MAELALDAGPAAQKNRIIRVLKRCGRAAGLLGDGINDGPPLHRGIIEGRRASGNMMKYLLMATSSNFGSTFRMAAASMFLAMVPSSLFDFITFYVLLHVLPA